METLRFVASTGPKPDRIQSGRIAGDDPHARVKFLGLRDPLHLAWRVHTSQEICASTDHHQK